VFVNTFHFTTNTPTPTELDDIENNLISFYNDTHAPGGAALATELSPNLIRAQSHVKIYNLDDVPPRVPLRDRTFTLTATGAADGFPNEVALCLSYKAAPDGGIPLSRQRGRVYIGPLASANWNDSGGDFVPSATVLNKLAGAGKFLASVVSTAVWVVHSQAQIDDGLTPEDFTVDAGFVDNAADTQRRRGRKAQSRTLWSV
jgi:hypothetical protein